MSVSLFLGRIHCLHTSFLLNRSTPFAASNTTTQASPPNAQFAIEYLVQSCGLSSQDAIRASRFIHHLKSTDKPDAVLQFLRQTGISESDIRAALLRNPRFICSSVEKTVRPNMAILQEVGLSIKDISRILSRKPGILTFNIVQKVEFWLGALGSVEYLTMLLKRDPGLLFGHLDKVASPNLSFLQEQCGLTIRQIVRLIRAAPRLITYGPEALKMVAERADKLGCARSSGTFLYALIVVSCLNERNIDARLDNMKSHGLLQEDVDIMIGRIPSLLLIPEHLVSSKMKFLLKEADCDKLDVVRNPSLLIYSLENRLIPRNVVRKLLMSQNIPAGNRAIASFMQPIEARFLEKFVLPHEHVIPGLHQAYLDAFPKNTEEK